MSNTLIQQQSLIPYWAATTNAYELSGCILAISLVVDSAYDVYLDKADIVDGAISLVFTQNGTKIFSLTCSKAGQYALDSYSENCSGMVVIGNIPDSLPVLSSIKINPCCIACINTTARGSNTLTVIQDGTTTVYPITENISLSFDSKFEVVGSNTGNAVDITIGMSDDNYKDYVTDTFDQLIDLGKVRSINNTTPLISGGGVVIGIKYDGVTVPVHKLTVGSKTVDNVFVLEGVGVLPCSLEDKIDRYVAPDIVRNYDYMPLDDAYSVVSSGSSSSGTRTKYKRDVKLLTSKTYDGVQLFDINGKYDK